MITRGRKNRDRQKNERHFLQFYQVPNRERSIRHNDIRVYIFLRFIIIFPSLYFITTVDFINDYLIMPFTSLTAYLSSLSLNLLGIHNKINGLCLVAPNRSVDITRECSAIEVFVFYLSWIVAYYKAVKEKIIGAVVGFSIIFLTNLLRVMAIFIAIVYLGRYELFHQYIGQAMIIAVTFGVLQLWTRDKLTPSALLSKQNLNILKRAALFFFTVAAGLIILDRVKNRELADYLTTIVLNHTRFLLGLFGIHTTVDNLVIRGQGANILFASGCLTTPLAVLYIAFVPVSGFSNKTKSLLLLAAIPIFYLISLFRVASFFIFPFVKPDQSNFFYNHQYTVFFIVLIVCTTLFYYYREEPKRAFKVFILTLLTAPVSIFIWRQAGPFYNDYLLNSLPAYFFGVRELAYDPNRILSSMPAFEFVLTVSLFLWFPESGIVKKVKRISCVLLFCYLWQLTVIGFIGAYKIPLYPRFLRVLSIAPPFVYWFYLLVRTERGKGAQYKE